MPNEKPSSVLVDSNVFIGLLRRGVDPVKTLGSWAGTADLATCGMVRVEVLRGLKVPKMRDWISDFLDVMIYVPSTNRLWEDTASLAWELDRKGKTIPAQDIFIAVCARRIGAAVLTDDAHFRAFPNLQILMPSEELEAW